MKNKKYSVDYLRGHFILRYRKILFYKEIQFTTYDSLVNYAFLNDLPISEFKWHMSAVLQIYVEQFHSVCNFKFKI